VHTDEITLDIEGEEGKVSVGNVAELKSPSI
jgi:hypothetical protein